MALQSSSLPAPIVEILKLVDPLRRPRPFDVDAALREAIAAAPIGDRAELAVAVAEWMLPRCATCDVAYTFNVLELANGVLPSMDDQAPAHLAARAHLTAARAYAFHQVGDKLDNLASARQHLDEAARLGAATIDARDWAAALLDVARAGELAGANVADHEALYAEILATTAKEAETYRRIVAARQPGRGSATAPEPQSSVPESHIDSLESLLEPHGNEILPFALAPAATRLGRLYLARAARGDGPRARHWLQAAERSFYYNPSLPPQDYARNQLALSHYFSVVSVNDAEDEEYVLNKAVFSLNLAYQLAGADADLQAECFLTAARLWSERDPARAAGFLASALELDGVTPAVRGRVEFEHARTFASSPGEALADVARAIELFRGARDAEDDMLRAMLFKARLLAGEAERNARGRGDGLRREATALLGEIAARRTERGDLYEAYSAHRTLAQWSIDRAQLAAALPHYENCRHVASVILDRDLRALADQEGGRGIDEERRAALIERPTSALLKAHSAQETAIQMASVDHQVAAYCAAKSGRLDEALQWMLGSRLRNLVAAGRLDVDPRRTPQPAADQIVVVPIVADTETILLLYRHGHAVEAVAVPLTHAQLRRMVFADSDDIGYDRGWVASYREYERDTPFASLATDHEEPNELWWQSLKDELARFGGYFAEPLLAALAERQIAAGRLLLVPTGLLSFLPLHAVELRDGGFVMDRFSLQLGFTPWTPSHPHVAEGSTPAATALVVRGENELLYTAMETRTIAALLDGKAIAVTSTASRRDRVLEAADGAAYLHFASHGVFEASRWIDSRIELGQGDAITLRDILARDLSRARLVTLSACETGVSHVAGLQEEFLGFPVVFAAAGAGAVMSTLWRVSDLASALLLETFYRRFLDGAHAAIALNEARQWLRQLTAGELVERARAELAAPKAARAWRPVECSGIIGRFEGVPRQSRPFHSPYHWAAFTLWQAD